MTKEHKLFKDTLIYGIGNFGSRILGFALLPFYTTVLSKSEYGYIDLIVMGATLFITVISLKLFDGVYRFLWDSPGLEERKELISSIFNVVMINFVIALGIGYLVIYLTGYKFLFGGLVVMWLLIRTSGEFFQQVARALGKNYVYSISGIILSVTMLLTNVLFLWKYRWGVEGFIWAMILSYGISTVYCFWASQMTVYYKPNIFSSKVMNPLLKYSLPLLPSAVSWWFIRISGRYVLSFFHGLDPVGIYAVSDKIPSMIYLVNMTFYMAWQDNVLKHAEDDDRNQFYKNTLNGYLKIGLSLIVFIVMFLKPFFYLMVNQRYHEAHMYVPWLLLAVFILCFAGQYDVFFMVSKQTKKLLYSSLLGALASIGLNLIFVPKYGLWATTISTLIAACVVCIIRVEQLKKEVNIIYDYKTIITLLLLLVLSSFSYSLSWEAYLLSAMIIFSSLVFINRETLSYLKDRCCRK